MNSDIEIHVPYETWDIDDDNIDVFITIDKTDHYNGTFVTLRNIASLFEKNKSTGECANGTYLWIADMIVVENMKIDTIRNTVIDLVKNGELEKACTKMFGDD